ncbi:MAG: serine/threonine-protein kinase [Planctomycetota bacterium]
MTDDRVRRLFETLRHQDSSEWDRLSSSLGDEERQELFELLRLDQQMNESRDVLEHGDPGHLLVEETPTSDIPITPPASLGLVEPNVGEFIGDYRLVSPIATGGMGSVYRASHRYLQREVAIKLIRCDQRIADDAIDRFEREMRVVGQLDHPNIIRAYDAGHAQSVHYIAMQLVNGIGLDELLRRQNRMRVADATEILHQVCSGLQHAWICGVVHRDVKPSNIMLHQDATEASGVRVVVLDFGLALSFQDQQQRLTAAGHTLGTPDYMAPEQWDGRPTDDPRSDIYSLGCTLYHLLAGSPPFDEAKSLPQKMQAHKESTPVALDQLDPDIPASVSEAVATAMAKEPKQRFADPIEFSSALTPNRGGSDLQRLLDKQVQHGQINQQDRRVLHRSGAETRPSWKERLTIAAIAIAIGLAGVAFYQSRFSEHKESVPVTDPKLTGLQLYIRGDEGLRTAFLVSGSYTTPSVADNSHRMDQDEEFYISGGFSEPRFWHVIWHDTAGEAAVVAKSGALMTNLNYPLAKKTMSVDQADPLGVHAIMILSSNNSDGDPTALIEHLRSTGGPPKELPHLMKTRGPGETSVMSRTPESYRREVEAKLPPGWVWEYAWFVDVTSDD